MKLFLIILMLFPILCSAQSDYLPGYIITKSGDTLNGFVKNINQTPYYALHREIKFKDNDKKKKTFTPEEIKGYQIQNDRYVSKAFQADSTKDFIKVVVSDYLSYYTFEETNGPGMSSFYMILLRGDDAIPFVYITNRQIFNFKKDITKFLDDAPELCEKIKNGVYKKKDILEIVKEYNFFKKNQLPHN